MLVETGSIVFFLVFSYLLARAFLYGTDRTRTRRLIVTFWGFTLVIFIAVAFGSRSPDRTAQPDNMPMQVADNGYVTSQSCRTCHLDQHQTWHASYHRTMTQRANSESVTGDFNDLQVEFDGRRYELSQHDGDYFVEMEDPLSESHFPPRIKKRITLVTGSHHMQIYWYSTNRHRELSLLPIVYLNDQQRWIPRAAAFIEPPDEQPAPLAGLWNSVCIKCHTTNGQPRITKIQVDFAGSTMDSHVSEFGIACEACHGPGEVHVGLNRDPQRRYGLHFSDQPDSSIVNPSRLTHVRSSQVCGQCHSVRTYFDRDHFIDVHFGGSRYRPGDNLDDHQNIFCNANLNRPSIQNLLEDNPGFQERSFWGDGMVRVSGREYNGLIETPCFQQGEMSCLSCHAMHKPSGDARSLPDWADDQLSDKMDSNHACTQCHTDFLDEKRLTGHTHHATTSSGSSCYNCHMPHTTYGLLKSIRSHEIDVPRVADSLEFGRPNACNLCHLDRSLSWAAGALHDWYGHDIPEMTADEQSVAASVLWSLRGDAGLRALMADAMQWMPAKKVSGTVWMIPYLAELMNDSYVAVRLIAFRAIKKLPFGKDLRFNEFATPDERGAEIERILLRWRNESRKAANPGPATLFDKDGELMLDKFREIRRQRDQRPVFLAE